MGVTRDNVFGLGEDAMVSGRDSRVVTDRKEAKELTLSNIGTRFRC